MPLDLRTAGHLKEHIIGMVCKRSGVYLISCLTGSQGCRCPDNMPFKTTTLLQSATGKSLNLWLNLWTGILHRRSRAIGRLDRHHRRSRADLHAPASRRRLSGDTRDGQGPANHPVASRTADDIEGPPADLPATGAVVSSIVILLFAAACGK